jgi:hypothetical protein
MVQNKDFKRLVRARMRKTGESYTTARAHIQRKGVADLAPVARASTPAAPDYAAIAGMSDAAIRGKTGRVWKEWVDALDSHGAAKLPHRDIAEIVNTDFGVGDWWTQTVTVGYERIKGLRARGQRRDGSYEASKSRTYAVPVAKLFDAWAATGARRRWLGETGVKVRTATAPKSMRLGWSDGTIVAVGFMPKGKGKSSVAVQHTKLPSRDAADRFRKYWSDRLDALAELLTAG